MCVASRACRSASWWLPICARRRSLLKKPFMKLDVNTGPSGVGTVDMAACAAPCLCSSAELCLATAAKPALEKHRSQGDVAHDHGEWE